MNRVSIVLVLVYALHFQKELKVIPQVVMFGVASTISYAIIIFCQYRVIRKLNALGASMRKSTQRIHADINKALVALAICPLLTAVGPTGYFVVTLCLGASTGHMSGKV
ncbi:hypothetical protein AAVH_26900 [Aphelenchoides avenae]|nr:hypothetical protein AAVH_26900 [Aphelenchus avenae]